MPTKTSEANFRKIVAIYGPRFMGDFNATKLDAAAVFGNAGHESLGMTILQEIKPTVKGSRGGYGWFQWTGPRRRTFEAYCARNKFNATEPETNYKFMFVELHGDEKGAIPKLKAAKTLEDKVKAFELGYERAGVKHYPERNIWANIALDTLSVAKLPKAEPIIPIQEKPMEEFETPLAEPSKAITFNWFPWALGAAVIGIVLWLFFNVRF